eukprot:jgi/Ulvmu1/1882/UM012_0039.1
MSSPEGEPEDGESVYHRKRSQGAACAVSCAAGLLFRNYYVPVQRPDGSWQQGQTSQQTLDGLEPLQSKLQLPERTEFECRAGYTLASDKDLRNVNKALSQLEPGAAMKLVRVGVHEDLQVTSSECGRQLCTDAAQLINQVFPPAASISWNKGTTLALWRPLATALLRAAYKATLWTGLRSAQRHWGRNGSTRVFLTMVGGGGFGTPAPWICEALAEALWAFRGTGLRVAVVLNGEAVPAELQAVLQRHEDVEPA